MFEIEYFKLAMKNTGKFTVLIVPLAIAISLLLTLLIVRFATQLPFVKYAVFLPVILPFAAFVLTQVMKSVPDELCYSQIVVGISALGRGRVALGLPRSGC